MTVVQGLSDWGMHSQELVHTQVWPFWALWGLSFVIILVLGFSQTARRRYPWCLSLAGLTCPHPLGTCKAAGRF